MSAKIFIGATLTALIFSTSTAHAAGDTPTPAGAKTYFVNVQDGDTLSNPVTLQFGLKGMGVAPAGVMNLPATGHHHLLINSSLASEALGRPIPADEQHKHFGKGQTEVTLELPVGTHTLQLVLGDWKHTPHQTPVMSDKITVTVK